MATVSRNDFVRVLKAFADSPNDVLDERSFVTCKINGDEITVTLKEVDDVLMCQEGDSRLVKARTWIEKRLARLDVLADKIIEAIPYDDHFVDVGAQYESVLSEGKTEPSVVDALMNRVSDSASYATEVLYLLSEAGDGKSAIMNRLAVRTAKRYKDNGRGPIFLPIGLDGRPFLRIDDLVIGILANHFRFRRFYFEGILELVKLGSLVLGLDGFEEMVVEGREEKVISSLGELLRSFENSGRIIISARRAFYEYALKKQLPLLDSVREMQVDCDAYRLSPWGEKEFKELLGTYPSLSNAASQIYGNLSANLSAGHPILVRPVLARKLVETVHAEAKNRDWNIIAKELSSSQNPLVVMREFVLFLVQREAQYKWVSTSGPNKGAPILSIDEHMSVMMAIAEDMWLSSVEYVKEDYLQDWMDLTCGDLHKGPGDTSDAREKILHHAILLRDGDRYRFCHEAFRRYFLGCDIARCVVSKSQLFALERIMSQDVLDYSVLKGAAFAISLEGLLFRDVIDMLAGIKGGVSKLSAIGQNVGSLVLAYTQYATPKEMVDVKDLFFTDLAASSAVLRNLNFVNCTFEEVDLAHCKAENLVFNHCTLFALRMPSKGCTASCVSFCEDSIPRKIVLCDEAVDEESWEVVYDPQQIHALLSHNHLIELIEESSSDDVIAHIGDRDERMSILSSLYIILRRTSGLSDRALEVRFGKKWHRVRDELLPVYVSDGILKMRDWYGGGGNERYSLNIPLSVFEKARENSSGDYASFVKAICQLEK